ncbi:MAG: hypothetical protein ABI306_08785 [Caulobacteraceae bacterium]
MPGPQEVNDFITARRPADVCNKCIADGVGMTNKAAHPAQIAGALGTTSDFTRGPGVCSICKEQKVVIHANRT